MFPQPLKYHWEELSMKKFNHKWEANDEIARYAVLSRKENESACEDGSRFMMIFTVKNVQGSLVKAINAISSNGFNIRFLHTRPLNYEVQQKSFFKPPPFYNAILTKKRHLPQELLRCKRRNFM